MPTSQVDARLANGHDTPTTTPATVTKGKGKQKKGLDSGEASKLLQARITQLELNAAGEKDQEAEIERDVKKACRELAQKMAKLDSMEQIDLLMKRCNELATDLRRAIRDNKNNKTRLDNLQREKDVNRAELNKATGLKEKLEKLCRELQKDNNKLKTENKDLLTSQLRTQAAWDQKYATLLAILDDYQQSNDKRPLDIMVSAVPHNINEYFRQKFKDFIEQYELRELHFHSLMRTKELEVQLSMTRYERERVAADMEAKNVRHWKSQAETALKTSSELFGALRKEMDERQLFLEKENESLKRKHDVAAASVFRAAEEREEWKRKAEASDKKTVKLTSIIQQMQQQNRRTKDGSHAQGQRCNASSQEANHAASECLQSGDGKAEERRPFSEREQAEEEDEGSHAGNGKSADERGPEGTPRSPPKRKNGAGIWPPLPPPEPPGIVGRMLNRPERPAGAGQAARNGH